MNGLGDIVYWFLFPVLWILRLVSSGRIDYIACARCHRRREAWNRAFPFHN